MSYTLIKNNYFKYLIYLIILFIFYAIFTQTSFALTMEDLYKNSQIKSYQDIKNINKIPLQVKIEQILFLNWNQKNIDKQTIKYLSEHNVGGVSITTPDLKENNKKQIKNFINSLKQSRNIPCFISINTSSLNYLCFTDYQSLQKNTIKKSQNISSILTNIGANTAYIPQIIINNKNQNNLNKQQNDNYQTLLTFVKQQNKNGIITSVGNIEISKSENDKIIQQTSYRDLINKTGFNQIIISSNKINNNLHFNGIIVNTALSNKDITTSKLVEKTIIKATLTGNSMIFYNGGNLEKNKAFVTKVTSIITKAIDNGIISMNDINASYIKIINLKTQFAIIKKETHC